VNGGECVHEFIRQDVIVQNCGCNVCDEHEDVGYGKNSLIFGAKEQAPSLFLCGCDYGEADKDWDGTVDVVGKTAAFDDHVGMALDDFRKVAVDVVVEMDVEKAWNGFRESMAGAFSEMMTWVDAVIEDMGGIEALNEISEAFRMVEALGSEEE